jgi:predicted RNase H-like nuclease (RuvC/YqgF family)
MPRDSMGIRTVSSYVPKEKTDAEKVESCTKEIKRLENLLDAQKRILASAEKRLEQASKED